MDNVKILREKKVKIRKNQECWKCNKIKNKGEKMLFHVIIYDERIINTYQCFVCKKPQKKTPLKNEN